MQTIRLQKHFALLIRIIDAGMSQRQDCEKTITKYNAIARMALAKYIFLKQQIIGPATIDPSQSDKGKNRVTSLVSG
jgi:hypothetical protein